MLRREQDSYSGCRLGIIPEQDIQKLAGIYSPLAEYISKKLGEETKLTYLDSYAKT